MSKKNIEKITEYSIIDKLSGKYLYIILFALLFISLMIFYKPMSIDGLDPGGADKLASIGQTHQYVEFRDKTGEDALWNPNIFGGVPLYFRLSNSAFNLDKLISRLNNMGLDWRIGWFLLGAIGMFLLFRTLGFPWYINIIGVIAFVFWPHFQGLIEVGHNAKIRAICAMPLVIYAFINYTKKRNLFSIVLFTLLFSLQFRTQHYQIIFYTLLIILGVGIYIIIAWIREKEYKRLYTTIGIFVVGLIVAILMSAQPLFVAKEYTEYSTRGGNAISLSEKKAESNKTGGVTFDYATQWSFAPKEMMTLISPRFYGGTSGETYTGKKFPHLKNKKIPGTYWGDMPFTQSSEYMGIIIVVLAVFGIWVNRKNGMVITFSVLLLFSLLLSFGRHFTLLYKLFFYYVPYFDKFRAPVMTLILVSFNVIVLAMYGLKSLFEIDSKEKLKPFIIISGFFGVIGLLYIIAPNLLSYSTAGDARYSSNPQVLGMIKNVRKEFMQIDTLRMLMFLGGFVTFSILFYLKKIKKEILILGIFLLVTIDSMSVSYRFISTAQFFNKKNAERRYFQKNQFDKIMDQDKNYYRVIEIGQGFTSNDLAYRHQLIGGYSAIKPQLIQDIVDNNLYHGSDPKFPINFNVINMLNGKYIVLGGNVNHPALEMLSVNKQQNKVLFKNRSVLPRVFFVEKTKKLSNEKEVVRYMNNAAFNPKEIALISNKNLSEKTYGIDGEAKITDYNPNSVKIDMKNNSESFMILSEAYFPIGWKCKIDNQETNIYQVNHILRGIEVPAGEHKIIFDFEPKSYKRANMISSITTYMAWLVLIGLLVMDHKNRLIGIIKRNK